VQLEPSSSFYEERKPRVVQMKAYSLPPVESLHIKYK
jgi:hypothetical protein